MYLEVPGNIKKTSRSRANSAVSRANKIGIPRANSAVSPRSRANSAASTRSRANSAVNPRSSRASSAVSPRSSRASSVSIESFMNFPDTVLSPVLSTTPDTAKITNIIKNKLYYCLYNHNETYGKTTIIDLKNIINNRNFPIYSNKNKSIYDKILSDAQTGKNKPFALQYIKVGTSKMPLSMKLKYKGYTYRRNLENLLHIDSGNFDNLPFKKKQETKARIKASNLM